MSLNLPGDLLRIGKHVSGVRKILVFDELRSRLRTPMPGDNCDDL